MQRTIESWLGLKKQNTQDSYRRIIREFLDYVAPIGLVDVTEINVLGYRKWCSSAKGVVGAVSAATVHRKLVILNKLYDYLLVLS